MSAVRKWLETIELGQYADAVVESGIVTEVSTSNCGVSRPHMSGRRVRRSSQGTQRLDLIFELGPGVLQFLELSFDHRTVLSICGAAELKFPIGDAVVGTLFLALGDVDLEIAQNLLRVGLGDFLILRHCGFGLGTRKS
jgi:hypothetical protein